MQKQSPTTASHSYIFSDQSKAYYRQESLLRKLKHIQQENNELQEKITLQQQDIKNQRTVIIYQMTELVKVIANRIGLYDDYSIKTETLGEDHLHEVLKQLMDRFQHIQKQAKMIEKVHTNISGMYNTYISHKESIQQMMKESSQAHQMATRHLSNLIQQKKNQLNKIQGDNTSMSEEIERMKSEMIVFQREEGELDQEEKELMKMIEKKENEIETNVQKYDENRKWTEIVVDKRYRHELNEKIQNKKKELKHLGKYVDEIGIKYREQSLKVLQNN